MKTFAALALLAGLMSAGCRSAQPPARLAPPQAAPTVTRALPQPLPAPKPPATAAKPAPVVVRPAPDPAAELIAAAEKDYNDGVALYRAGQLDAARVAFDSAIDRMLTTALDVRRTPALEAELERLVDHIHALETDALREGEGFTAQQQEPAPIDAVAELTFPLDAATRAEVERSIRNLQGDLPLVLTDPVIKYIHYFSTPGGREYLLDGFRHAGRYRALIQRVFEKEGVPQDLIYLAQAESGFRPLSLSHQGALGIWQFMSSRADDYKLRHSAWIDERQDPEKSTVAAARHLKDLYKQFGDWYLAMAAYDSGPATIQRAVAETGSADFWELYRRGVLPRETRNYVPIILATALIAKNPAQYGINQVVEDQPQAYDSVTLTAPVDLRLAAECAGSSVVELQKLNPVLLRLTTPRVASFTLHLPEGAKPQFEQALALIPPRKRILWRYHRLTAGETVASLAQRYHLSATEILEANRLTRADELAGGERLIIPISELHYVETTRRYRVRHGDTLLSVARSFGVSEAQLRRWNHLRNSQLHAGRVVYLHLVLSDAEAGIDDSRPAAKSHKTKHLRDASARRRQPRRAASPGPAAAPAHSG